MRKILSASWISTLLMIGSAVPVAAQTIDIKPKGDFAKLGDITVPSIVAGLISLVLVIAALIFFFMLVIGGIRWMLSGGDKANTEGARGQITAALVGLVIVFAAWAIIQLIKTLFGVDILGGLDIPAFY